MLQELSYLYSKDMKKMIKKNRDRIMENYTLAPGKYILVDENGKENILELDKKATKENKRELLYEEIAKYDYLSVLIDMNKPIDSKKVIQSNNYLSFIVKKESLHNGKLTQERIDDYYKFTGDLSLKYSGSADREKRKILATVVEKYGEGDQKKLKANKKWIEDNLERLKSENEGKDYLKIFFKADIKEYEKELRKYLLPNIYNNNKYNAVIDGEVRGLLNYNMNMNDKKPYLENKTRKNSIPSLRTLEEVLEYKLLFDFLMSQASMGKNYIYMNEDDIVTLNYDEDPSSEFGVDVFTGVFLNIKKGKELEIHDFKYVTFKKNKKKVVIKNLLGVNYDKINGRLDGTKDQQKNETDLKNYLNSVFYFKTMWKCLLDKTDEYRVRDDKKQEKLLLALKEPIYQWAYESDTTLMKRYFAPMSLDIIKHMVYKGNEVLAKEMYNLREAILEFLEVTGEIKKLENLENLSKIVKEKCESSNNESLEEKEFSFVLGQIIYYLCSLKKSKKESVRLLLNSRNTEAIKRELRHIFKTYSHEINFGSKKFESLFHMIEKYQGKKIDSEVMLIGYLMSNINYKPKEEKAKEEIEKIKETLKPSEIKIDSSYALGQLAYYFLYKKEGNNKKHDLARFILNKRFTKGKSELMKFFNRYKYDLKFKYNKFSKLFEMVLASNNDKIVERSLLMGYMGDNILLNKSIKHEDIENSSLEESKFIEIRKKLDKAVEEKNYENLKIDTKEEISYVLGQLVYRILFLNESSKATHQLVSESLNYRKPSMTINYLNKLEIKYKSKVRELPKSFFEVKEIVEKSIERLEEKNEKLDIDKDYFLGGYLGENLMFAKKREEEK